MTNDYKVPGHICRMCTCTMHVSPGACLFVCFKFHFNVFMVVGLFNFLEVTLISGEGSLKTRYMNRHMPNLYWGNQGGRGLCRIFMGVRVEQVEDGIVFASKLPILHYVLGDVISHWKETEEQGDSTRQRGLTNSMHQFLDQNLV